MNHLEIMEQDGVFGDNGNNFGYDYLKSFFEEIFHEHSNMIMAIQTNDWY